MRSLVWIHAGRKPIMLICRDAAHTSNHQQSRHVRYKGLKLIVILIGHYQEFIEIVLVALIE
jgi:hypothetical protein